MLNFKERIYVKKLIFSKKLLISKKDREKLTKGDIFKLRFISGISGDEKIYWHFIKNVSLDQMKQLLRYLTFDLNELNIFFSKWYNIQKFIEEILMVYKDSYSRYIIKMIKLNYSIDQIKFLLERKMLYNSYNINYNYYEIFTEYTNLGFDPSQENVILYSTSFLKKIRKIYSITECYILTNIKQKKYYYKEDEFLNLILLLHDNNFSVYEIFTLCNIGCDIDIDDIRTELIARKTKDQIFEKYIFNSNCII